MEVVCFLLSRTGASAVTTTSSVAPATPILMLSGMLTPAATVSCGLCQSLNPARLAFTWYLPTGRFTNRASPRASVVAASGSARPSPPR